MSVVADFCGLRNETANIELNYGEQLYIAMYKYTFLS